MRGLSRPSARGVSAGHPADSQAESLRHERGDEPEGLSNQRPSTTPANGSRPWHRLGSLCVHTKRTNGGVKAGDSKQAGENLEKLPRATMPNGPPGRALASVGSFSPEGEKVPAGRMRGLSRPSARGPPVGHPAESQAESLRHERGDKPEGLSSQRPSATPANGNAVAAQACQPVRHKCHVVQID
jgi:hypothetical protein